MPARQGTHRKPKRPIGDPSEPGRLWRLVAEYLEALQRPELPRRAPSRTTSSSLGIFVDWCEARSLTRPREVTKPILERYQRHLTTTAGHGARRPAAVLPNAAHPAVGGARVFQVADPPERSSSRIPRASSSCRGSGSGCRRRCSRGRRSRRCLLRPSPATAVGLRDRAILETLYATGVRRSELVGLRLYDLDRGARHAAVRQGKGRQGSDDPDRRASARWIGRYLEEVRPALVMLPDEGFLFLTTLGEPLTPDFLTQSVRRYVLGAEIGKSGSCHLFRHTMATLMLEGGADIRYIQEMLGHAHLDSTEVYTQVSFDPEADARSTERRTRLLTSWRSATMTTRTSRERTWCPVTPANLALGQTWLGAAAGAAEPRCEAVPVGGRRHAGQCSVSRTSGVAGRFPPAPSRGGATRARAPGPPTRSLGRRNPVGEAARTPRATGCGRVNAMQLKARVEGGQLVLKEPTDLPEGEEVQLQIADEGDELDDEERARLHASLERSVAQAKAGKLIPASEVMSRLRSRR